MTACTGFLKCFVLKYKDVKTRKGSPHGTRELSSIEETNNNDNKEQEPANDTAVTSSPDNCDNKANSDTNNAETPKKADVSASPCSDNNISTIELEPVRSSSVPVEDHKDENNEDLTRRQSLPNGRQSAEPKMDPAGAGDGVPTTTTSTEKETNDDVSVVVTASPPGGSKWSLGIILTMITLTITWWKFTHSD